MQETLTQTMHDFFRASMLDWIKYPNQPGDVHRLKFEEQARAHFPNCVDVETGKVKNRQPFQVGRALAFAPQDVVDAFFDPDPKLALSYRELIQLRDPSALTTWRLTRASGGRKATLRITSHSCASCGAPLDFTESRVVTCRYCDTVSQKS